MAVVPWLGAPQLRAVVPGCDRAADGMVVPPVVSIVVVRRRRQPAQGKPAMALALVPALALALALTPALALAQFQQSRPMMASQLALACHASHHIHEPPPRAAAVVDPRGEQPLRCAPDAAVAYCADGPHWCMLSGAACCLKRRRLDPAPPDELTSVKRRPQIFQLAKKRSDL